MHIFLSCSISCICMMLVFFMSTSVVVAVEVEEEEVTVETVEEVKEEVAKPTKEGRSQPQLSRKGLYKAGFGLKRAEQVEGVKRIQKFTDYSKRYKMVEILLNNLFKVLIKAKVAVIEMGYVPGDEFPEEQDKLDNLGHVFENVALFGDLILRCPDVTHKLYNLRSKQEWKVSMNWGFIFSNETGIFEGGNAKLLHLAAQELEIIPKEENFVNPYKEAEKRKKELEKLKVQEKKKKEQEKKKKTKRKSKRKGPRLGGGSGEL